jgi:hypothetical protein
MRYISAFPQRSQIIASSEHALPGDRDGAVSGASGAVEGSGDFASDIGGIIGSACGKCGRQ